jgi:hypothetical protein
MADYLRLLRNLPWAEAAMKLGATWWPWFQIEGWKDVRSCLTGGGRASR